MSKQHHPGLKYVNGQWVPATRQEIDAARAQGANYQGPQIVSPTIEMGAKDALKARLKSGEKVASEYQRPDVNVPGQVNDRIDDHYVAWMRERADEDVVKTASAVDEIVKATRFATTGPGLSDAEKVIKKKLLHSHLKGLGLGTALGVGGLGAGMAVMKKKAAIITCPENEELLARIRRLAQDNA